MFAQGFAVAKACPCLVPTFLLCKWSKNDTHCQMEACPRSLNPEMGKLDLTWSNLQAEFPHHSEHKWAKGLSKVGRAQVQSSGLHLKV